MKTTLAFIVITSAFVGGCASTPPRELNDARAMYQRAASAPGASLAQSEVYDARKALSLAEAKFKDDGDEPETRDLAYIAQRKAVSAHARGNAAQSLSQKKMAEANLLKFNEMQTASLKGQLASSKGALADAQRMAESERQARQAADAKASDALARIAGLQSKQTDRGLVLTLSGSVLFATGKSVLLPQSHGRLGEVANALKEDKRSFTILGHTDSKGTDELNQQLSEARAEAVKKYLVSQGIEENRIRAMGMGEKEPVTTNETAEGRANNRRVEIVLEKPQR